MIHYGAAHWSLGVLVTLPLMILIVLSIIGVGVWLRKKEWGQYNKDLGVWLPRLAWTLAVVWLLITALAFFPYKAEYHQWRDVSGTITSTNSRFIANNNGTDQKFVVTFQGSSQQFGCNDSRCSTVRVGDELTIACKRSWQWFSTPGYDCNFRSYKPQG